MCVAANLFTFLSHFSLTQNRNTSQTVHLLSLDCVVSISEPESPSLYLDLLSPHHGSSYTSFQICLLCESLMAISPGTQMELCANHSNDFCMQVLFPRGVLRPLWRFLLIHSHQRSQQELLRTEKRKTLTIWTQNFVLPPPRSLRWECIWLSLYSLF